MYAPRMFAILALLVATLSSAGAGRDLAPRAIAPTAYFAMNPEVAYAGGRFLSIWTEEMGSLGRPVKGAFLDESGRRISPEGFTILEASPTGQLVPVGDRFALFWSGTGATRYLTWIDRNGTVSPARVLDLPASEFANFAWNGSRFLVALWSSTYLHQPSFSVLLDGEGNVLRNGIPTGEWVWTIAPQPDGFLLFSRWPALTVQRVSAEGESQPVVELAAQSYSSTEPVNARRSDGSVLIAWASTDGSESNTEIRAAVIAADGSIARAPHVIHTSEKILNVHRLMATSYGALLLLSVRDEPGVARLVTMKLDPVGAMISASGANGPIVGQIAATDNGSIVVVTGSIDEPWSLRVRSVAIDANGLVTSPRDVSLAPARQTLPQLASGAWRLLALWTDREGDDAWLRSASISPEGDVTQRSTTGTGRTASEDIAWNGAMYLAVHLEAGLLHARRLTADGEAIDAHAIVVSPRVHDPWKNPEAHVVASGTSWLVASEGAASIEMTAVTAAGVAGPTRTLDVLGTPPRSWSAFGKPVGLAFDGGRTLLVWNESHESGCMFPICPAPIETMRARLLDAAGEPIGDAIDLSMVGVADDIALATSGSEFVVVGPDAAVVVRRAGDALEVVASRELRGVGDIFWDGVSYVHAYRSSFVQALEVARYGRALEPMGEPRYVGALIPDNDSTTHVSVARLAGRPALVATSEGTAVTGARARTYSEEEFGALPPRPGMARNVRTQRLDDGRYLTTWDPPLTGPVDGYQYEERGPAGAVWQILRLGADVRSRIGSQPFVSIRALNAWGYSDIARRRRAIGQ